MTFPPGPHIFDLTEAGGSRQLLSELAGQFHILTSAAGRHQLSYYDTFDWRLHERKLELVREKDEFRLQSRDNFTPVATARVTGRPRFWREFPEGGLREQIRPLTKERAVVEVGSIGLRVRDIRILDELEKTVVRLRLEEIDASRPAAGGKPKRLLSVLPVRGYRKDFHRVVRFLTGAGYSTASTNAFATAVQALGRKAGDYTSKLRVQLDPAMPAQAAAGVIFRYLLNTIEQNEPGIRDDLDAEFLHDFRVAIRRTRTGLSQLKGVLPRPMAEAFRGRFGEIGGQTNRLRDLDVYLLRQEDYRRLLGEDLRPGLCPLFDELAEERRAAQAAAVRLLDSRPYRDLVEDWRHTLSDLGTPCLEAKRTREPVISIARRTISKQYAGVLRAGQTINENSPAADLHSLRISCKKLRYLLEFFASLFAAEDTETLVKQLQQLQDNLGDFNDLSVHQAELKNFLIQSQAARSTPTAAAIGGLIVNLESLQRETRKRFSGSFRLFADPGNRNRFERIFQSG